MSPDSNELQRAIEEARAIVKYHFPWWLRPFLLTGVAGITLGRRVYVDSPGDVTPIVRHELVHVRQIQRLGAIRFYWSYLREYVSNRRRGFPTAEAYRRISLEREAFAAEREETL